MFLVIYMILNTAGISAEVHEVTAPTEFPSDTPSTTTELKINDGQFELIDPSVLTGLPVLWKIEILTADLTTFPDFVEVAGTLTTVILEKTNIADINPAYLSQLHKLEVLKLTECPLEVFPSVSGLESSLVTLDLSKTSLKCFPTLSTFPSLETLHLNQCWDMDFCSGNALENADSLKVMYIMMSSDVL